LMGGTRLFPSQKFKYVTLSHILSEPRLVTIAWNVVNTDAHLW
jgi:hypothetical protein